MITALRWIYFFHQHQHDVYLSEAIRRKWSYHKFIHPLYWGRPLIYYWGRISQKRDSRLSKFIKAISNGSPTLIINTMIYNCVPVLQFQNKTESFDTIDREFFRPTNKSSAENNGKPSFCELLRSNFFSLFSYGKRSKAIRMFRDR